MTQKQLPELLILVGVPGSGKTTVAKQLLLTNSNYVRINRDDLRLLLANSYNPNEDIENLVSKIQDAAIDSALRSGKSVIVDNTHCKLKYIKELITKFAPISSVSTKFVGAELTLKDLYKRNDEREKKVPEAVIERMYKGFTQVIKGKKDIQLHIDHTYGLDLGLKPNYDDTLPHAILVDIDGTVAHMKDHRGPFEWHKVDLDDPDYHVLSIIRALASSFNVIFMSGRDESCRSLTEEWLRVYYGKPYKALYMRPANNYQKDNIVKTDLFNKYIKDNFYVVGVFDDRDQVVSMWRKQLGLKCFQVDYGNF